MSHPDAFIEQIIMTPNLGDKDEDENLKCGESHDEAIEAFAGLVPDPIFCRRHGRFPPDFACAGKVRAHHPCRSI
jgi:hypothetical protein